MCLVYHTYQTLVKASVLATLIITYMFSQNDRQIAQNVMVIKEFNITQCVWIFRDLLVSFFLSMPPTCNEVSFKIDTSKLDLLQYSYIQEKFNNANRQ